MRAISSVLILAVLWQVAAFLTQDPSTLPGPATVLALTWSEAFSGELFFHLGATLARTLAAFVIAMGLGSAIGIMLGRNAGWDAWGGPWLIGLLNLPALVTIVLCYIWIGLTEVAAIAAVVINKVPLVATQLREGAKALDPKLDDLAQAFKLSRRDTVQHIVLPQLAPSFAAAGRTGIALIWKIVLVVELLGRSNGVGFQIHSYFQLFDVGRVLVYALSFVAVMLLIETLFLIPWERHATRWRRQSAD